MSRKGSSSFTLLSIVLSVIVIGGVFFFIYNKPPVVGGPTTIPTSTAPTPTTPLPAPSPAPLPQPTSTAPLSPSSGKVGTVVTIHGIGFAKTPDNTILMNGMVGGGFKNIASKDGETLTFTVPENLGPDCDKSEMCAQYLVLVTNGSYKITVVTNGVTQSFGSFTVTGGTSLQVQGQAK